MSFLVSFLTFLLRFEAAAEVVVTGAAAEEVEVAAEEVEVAAAVLTAATAAFTAGTMGMPLEDIEGLNVEKDLNDR